MIKSLNRNKEIFFEYTIYLFIVTLPLWRQLNTWMLLPLTISWFSVSTWKSKKTILKEHKTSFIFIVSIFVFLFLSIYHDANYDLSISTKFLGFIILPLIFLSINKELIKLKNILLVLGIGVLIGMIISWSSVIFDIFNRESGYLKQAKYFFQWIYTGGNLLKIIGIHQSYFAIMLVFFISSFLYNDSFMEKRKNKWSYIIVFLYLLFLLETTSRASLISFIIIVLVQSISYKSIRYTLIPATILFFIALQLDFLLKKINVTINDERYFRWGEIFNLFHAKKDIFLGWGYKTAEKNYLDAFLSGGYDLAYKENYNAHNQYLELLFKTGVFGLLAYIGTLIHFIRKTKLVSSALYFIIIVLILSFGESFLERNKGIFFFSTFYSILINKYGQK